MQARFTPHDFKRLIVSSTNYGGSYAQGPWDGRYWTIDLRQNVSIYNRDVIRVSSSGLATMRLDLSYTLAGLNHHRSDIFLYTRNGGYYTLRQHVSQNPKRGEVAHFQLGFDDLTIDGVMCHFQSMPGHGSRGPGLCWVRWDS